MIVLSTPEQEAILHFVEKVEMVAAQACEDGLRDWNDYMDARLISAEAGEILAIIQNRIE